jgi:hypothetical protein
MKKLKESTWGANRAARSRQTAFRLCTLECLGRWEAEADMREGGWVKRVRWIDSSPATAFEVNNHSS